MRRQNASITSGSGQRVTSRVSQIYGPRMQNLSPLAWGGIGLGTAALAAGGYYLWRRREATQLVEATGIMVNDDCSMMKVLDPEVSIPYFESFIDATLEQLDDVPVDTLVLAASYMASVAPTCGVSVSEDGIDGVDSWQKAAMVGGLAILASGTLQEDGRMSAEAFNDEAEAIQEFLLANGVDDISMVEQVFELPEEDTTQATGGVGGPMDLVGRVQNRRHRKANLGILGVLGWGALGLGVAGVAGAGFLWNRNKKMTEACLGDVQWLETDGSLSEDAEAQLDTAIKEAIADGATTAIAAAESAIVKVSGNPDCTLPNLIWGDLLRIRAATLAMAAQIMSLSTSGEGPGADVTGLEANLECTTMLVRDRELSSAYYKTFIDDLQLGQGLQDTIVIGARFYQRIAPHCGVRVDEGGQVLGVDTREKAAVVGAFALITAGTLKERGKITEAEFGQEMLRIGEWLRANGVDDLADMGEVFNEGGTGFSGGDVETDTWGEPVANDMVDSGTVGGATGGRWRVYQDNAGSYGGGYYFLVWFTSTGDRSKVGGFEDPSEAAEAALALLTSKEAGIASNPGRARGRIVRTPTSDHVAKKSKGTSRRQTMMLQRTGSHAY